MTEKHINPDRFQNLIDQLNNNLLATGCVMSSQIFEPMYNIIIKL